MIVVGLLLFFVVISVFTSNSYEDAAQSGFDISNFNEGWTFVYQGQRQIDFYESLRDGKPSIYADYRQTKEKVFSLRRYIGSHIGKKVLSHIDPVADNFLIIGTGDKEDIRLIDWEYSGMQDPHVDIAMFCIYALYDKQGIDRVIKAYFPEGCPEEIRIKIYCYISVCGLLWSNWCEYKRNLGAEFGEYALKQYDYAKNFFRNIEKVTINGEPFP